MKYLLAFLLAASVCFGRPLEVSATGEVQSPSTFFSATGNVAAMQAALTASFQPLDPQLTGLAALSVTNGQFLRATGPASFEGVTTFTGTAAFGTAAYTAASAYATAAQGTKADSALQTITGSNGVSVATPGTGTAALTISAGGSNKFIGSDATGAYATYNIGRFQPEKLSGTKKFWYDPLLLSGADGTSIATIPDAFASGTISFSGTGTSGFRPTLQSRVLNGRPGLVFSNTQRITTPTNFLDSSFNTAFSVACVYQATTGATQGGGFLFEHTNTNQRFKVTIQNNFLVATIANNSALAASAINNSIFTSVAGTYVYVILITYDGANLKIFVNGVQTATVASSASLAMSGALVIGSADGTFSNVANGYFGDVLAANAAWSANEVVNLSNFLMEKYNLNKRRLFFVGDSITAGVTLFDSNMVYVTGTALGTVPWLPINLGVSGVRTDGITNNNWVTNAVMSDKGDGMAYWGGTNDIGQGVNTPATTYGNIVTYTAARRAEGMRVGVVTMLPSGTSATVETNRLSFNTLLTSGTAPFDYVLDVAADPVIGYPGAQNDTTYYDSDKIHLKKAGESYLSALYANFARKIMNGSDPIRDNGVAAFSATGTTYFTPASPAIQNYTGTGGSTAGMAWVRANNGLAFTFNNVGTGTLSIVTTGSGDYFMSASGSTTTLSVGSGSNVRLRYSGSFISAN